MSHSARSANHGTSWRRRAILILALATLPLHLPAQASPPQPAIMQAPADRLNLGFETVSILAPTAPGGWYTGGHGYDVVLDTVAPFAGRRSLRIRALASAAPGALGVATNAVMADGARGRTIRLRGYIRTEGTRSGYAGLWLRTDAADGRMLALENMQTHGATGTSAWAPYEIALPVDTAASSIAFGVLHTGDGTAWFDSLSLSVDGRSWSDAPAPAWAPSEEELAWVRRAAIPLASVDADAPTTDLAPLGRLLGGAGIVALGEGTHGTSEFFRMKHRLTRYLATTHAFTVFAIEANMPEARRLNEYVRTGRGDPAGLLAGMYFWTWNTREVLDLIEWMRAYNASGAGRLEFWGFDLQVPIVAMDSVRAFVARAEPGFLPAVDSAYERVRTAAQERQRGMMLSPSAVGLWRDAAARVRAHLEAGQQRYAITVDDTTEVAWAVQYARIVEQGALAAGASNGYGSRDSSMAANVRWMLAHLRPGTKAVLWAHNAHVQRAPGAMGGHLDAMYGRALRIVGFALGDGRYSAIGPRGLTDYPAEPPAPGSVESVLRATGLPRLALDLRAAKLNRQGAWLAAPHDFRIIGAMARERAFAPTAVAQCYDLLVYVDHTSATHLLGSGR